MKMTGDQLWRLAIILGQCTLTLVLLLFILGLVALYRRNQLTSMTKAVVSQAHAKGGEVLQGDGAIVCSGAPTPLQALCTPSGTQFVAFSVYEAHVLLHEMYHGSTDSRLQDSGFDTLDGRRPYVVDVSDAPNPEAQCLTYTVIKICR